MWMRPGSRLGRPSFPRGKHLTGVSCTLLDGKVGDCVPDGLLPGLFWILDLPQSPCYVALREDSNEGHKCSLGWVSLVTVGCVRVCVSPGPLSGGRVLFSIS